MASSSPQEPASAPSISRRPYFGSCHCGDTRYVAFLSFPPKTDPDHFFGSEPPSSIRIYKCDCATCHKMGFFHTRLKDPPNDFFLLSPLNPEIGELSDYQCNREIAHLYFCKKCGVRCFAISGEGEVREVDGLELGENGGGGGGGGERGKMTKVWALKDEGWAETTHYFSLNAMTLEPGQEGLSLREWTEKGWIGYNNYKEHRLSFDRPGERGIY